MKDTNNIVSIDVWCAGEFRGNEYSFTRTQSSILTNKYSSIGESCIGVGRTSDTWWIQMPTNISVSGTYTFSVDVLNCSGGNSNLRVNEGGTIVSQVSIPESNSWQTFTLSASVSSAFIYLMNYGTNDNLFFDNVRVTQS